MDHINLPELQWGNDGKMRLVQSLFLSGAGSVSIKLYRSTAS